MKVSVIIPIYNTKPYLRACIDSALAQTLKGIEVILVNDGSTDGSGEIAEIYDIQRANVTYLEQENQGLGATRNRGLSVAEGKYVYFLDSDDFIEPRALEELYEEAEDRNLDLVLFDGISFGEEDLSGSGQLDHKYERSVKYDEVLDGQEFFARLVSDGNFLVSTCLYFVRKSIIDNNALKFREDIVHEDELFTFDLFLHASKVRHIAKPYFHRRVRPGSLMTSTKQLKSFLGYNAVLSEMLDTYNQFPWSGDFIRAAAFRNMGNVYRGAMLRMHSLDKNERLEAKEEIQGIRKIGKEHHYFGIRMGALLTNHYRLFKVLASIKHGLNREKAKKSESEDK